MASSSISTLSRSSISVTCAKPRSRTKTSVETDVSSKIRFWIFRFYAKFRMEPPRPHLNWKMIRYWPPLVFQKATNANARTTAWSTERSWIRVARKIITIRMLWTFLRSMIRGPSSSSTANHTAKLRTAKTRRSITKTRLEELLVATTLTKKRFPNHLLSKLRQKRTRKCSSMVK